MRKTRSNKKGFIYLLSNNDDIYKYGCTTLAPEERMRRINYTNKQYNKFNIIGSYSSSDIFKSEMNLKWSLWKHHMAPSEFFYGEHDLIMMIFKEEELKHV